MLSTYSNVLNINLLCIVSSFFKQYIITLINYYRIIQNSFIAIKMQCLCIPPWWMTYLFKYISVQSLSRVQLFATPWIAAYQASLSITNSQRSPKFMCIQSMMPTSHLILCRLLLLCPIPPSIRVFPNESTLPMGWPKYWSFNLSISPSIEHPGLVSFRMDYQECSPAPQFKCTNSSALSFLHSPTLTSIHDHRKNHSLD